MLVRQFLTVNLKMIFTIIWAVEKLCNMFFNDEIKETVKVADDGSHFRWEMVSNVQEKPNKVLYTILEVLHTLTDK